MFARKTVLLLLSLCLLLNAAHSQDSTSLYDRLYDLPDNFFKSINSKTHQLDKKLNAQSEKYLSRLQSQEKKLQKKLARKDSAAAIQLFGDIDARYAALRNKLTNVSASTPLAYSGHVDSIKTLLNFIQQNIFLSQSKEMQQKLKVAIENYSGLQQKLSVTSEVQKLVKERQEYLKSKLGSLGLSKQFKKLEKDVYYYRAQVDEYKNLMNDPQKLERKALQLAKKIPAFNKFFNSNSEIARMFSLPDDYGSMASLQGLQTRTQVQQLIQNRINAGGPGAQQVVIQNIQQAQSELAQLKNKITNMGGGGSDHAMPDFKPNNQKVKPFLKRIELGTDFQTVRSNGYFPTTSDIGLSAGYKLNDKSIVGLGVGYKLGLGKDIRHIEISHQGIGLRSFIDLKLKGSIWISGGAEMNYRTAFENIATLTKYDQWQKAALIGLVKKYSIKNKMRGKMQLSYDILHASQIPKTQPIVFRIGFGLNK